MVRPEFTILIADRNRHIRDFLQRELTAEGHRILLACDGRAVSKLIDAAAPDLLIIDPDIPYVDELGNLLSPQNHSAHLPVVVHTHLAEYVDHPGLRGAAALVEKDGTNVDILKDVISDALRKHYPHRFH